MKKRLISAAILLLFFLQACKKDSSSPIIPNKAHVTVQIDYLGSGGYYNDDISGIPAGLIIGTNGPYDVDASQTYTIDYKPSSYWNTPVHLGGVTFTAGTNWIIHCYVQGNIAYVNTYPQ